MNWRARKPEHQKLTLEHLELLEELAQKYGPGTEQGTEILMQFFRRCEVALGLDEEETG